jgi:nicotinamidase-related amidase
VIVRKGDNKDFETYSGFGTEACRTDLNNVLKKANITDVVSVGLAYDYCVGNTAYDAKDFGYNSYLITDATKGIAD